MLLQLFLYAAILTVGVRGAAVMPTELDGRIVGGTTTNIADFPWLVSLQRYASHTCAGSIYNERIIVTSALCVQNAPVESLRVRAGSTYWNSGGVVLAVAAVKVHEHYDVGTMANNIAVVRLQSSLSYSASIWYISVAGTAPANGAPAVVAGWGATSYGSATIPNALQSIDVHIVGERECASSTYAYGAQIRPNMICASADAKGACDGDHGSSLVADGALVGIYSWAFGCGFDKYPGVYTDVAAYRLWIAQAAGSV